MSEQKDSSVMSIAEAEVEIAFYRDQMRRAKLGLPVFEPRGPSARELDLRKLRVETDILREQIKVVTHHVNFLRDCMLRQARMNEQIIDYVDRRDRRTAP